jgi:hypothetical protein
MNAVMKEMPRKYLALTLQAARHGLRRLQRKGWHPCFIGRLKSFLRVHFSGPLIFRFQIRLKTMPAVRDRKRVAALVKIMP